MSICEDGVPEGVLRDEVARDDIQYLPRAAVGSRGEVGAQGVGLRTCMTVGSDINL